MAKVWVLGEEPEKGKRGKEWKMPRPKGIPKQKPATGGGEYDGSVICACQIRKPDDPKKMCGCTEIHQYRGKPPKGWKCGPCSHGGGHTWVKAY